MQSSNYLLLFALLTSLVRFPVAASAGPAQAAHRSWAADNGNGTYSNPLFYDEFSDPDMIRVGADYYLTGTTMHAMPGLPILHSRDLVNWRFLAMPSTAWISGRASASNKGKKYTDRASGRRVSGTTTGHITSSLM